MNDDEIIQRIHELVEEEHRLETQHREGEPLTDDEVAALRQKEVALDQCWDLLRQRRARRNAGKDPDSAEVRSSGIVENYRQ
jgi:hypothetical protein